MELNVTAKRQLSDSLCNGVPKTDWTGKWIWLPDSSGYTWRNSYAFFRKRFNAEGEVTINIAADTRYDLFLNGYRIDRGSAPSAIAYKAFDTHTVSVNSGEHVIGVMVHHIGEECATAEKSRPGLLVEISTSNTTVTSDETWKVLPGDAFQQDDICMMSHFGFYEVCDLNQIPERWNKLDFNDNGWLNAEVIGPAGCEPWTHLIPRDIPLLAAETIKSRLIACGHYQHNDSTSTNETETSVATEMAACIRSLDNSEILEMPIKLGEQRNQFAVFDFGREVTGHVRITIDKAASGQQLDIGYDEILDSDGLPNPRRTYVHFADRFYLRSGHNDLEVFDGRGFRYLLIDVPAGMGGVVITSVELDERAYPVSRTGNFQCSDKNLEELYSIGLETTRLCMLDTYVDCPSRERVMWMDSYIEALCSSYGMGITDLWRRVLYIFAQDTKSAEPLGGAVKGFAPSDRDPIVQTYALYYICSLADYVMFSGDKATGNALYETAVDQFRVVEQFKHKTGLIGDGWPDWQFIDWSAMDYGGMSASVNAIYIAALRKASELAGILGKASESNTFADKASKLIPLYWDVFWSKDEGLFIDAISDDTPGPVRSQLSNVLAIWAGAVAGDEARSIIRRITDKDKLLPLTPGDYRLKPEFKPQTGGIVPIGTPAMGTLLAHVMFKLGMDTKALQYLKDAWTPLAINGTFAEHYMFDQYTSMCHGWSAGPVMLLPRHVLGVHPVAPNWSVVEIAPNPGHLTWAKGSVPTPKGEICVEWRVVDGTTVLDVEAPDSIRIVKR